MQIPQTRLFYETLNSDKSVIIHRGGARSSKSISILNYIIYRMTNEVNGKIAILRKTLPSLKITAYKDFVDLLQKYDLYRYCNHSLSNNYITYLPTNTFIAFLSLDNPERIKSSEWNVVFLEEISEFSYNDYMILRTRLSAHSDKFQNKLIGALNPVNAFSWVKTELLDKDSSVHEIISNYKDNPFLDKSYVDTLEALKEQDINYYKIYALGIWGSLEHNIYNNWTEVKDFPIPEQTIWGCDFGYNVPSTIVQIGVKPEGLYVRERLYQSNLTNEQLINFILSNLPPGITLFCDSAEPARLAEMRRRGIEARPADKSVKDGIDFVKRQKLFITSDSVNVLKEIRAYTYKTKDEQVIDDPIKFNDHAMDAMRYGIYTYFKKPTYSGIISSEDTKYKGIQY